MDTSVVHNSSVEDADTTATEGVGSFVETNSKVDDTANTGSVWSADVLASSVGDTDWGGAPV